eukprot:jgi/Psemu1/11409/gm1.11409_g
MKQSNKSEGPSGNSSHTNNNNGNNNDNNINQAWIELGRRLKNLSGILFGGIKAMAGKKKNSSQTKTSLLTMKKPLAESDFLPDIQPEKHYNDTDDDGNKTVDQTKKNKFLCDLLTKKAERSPKKPTQHMSETTTEGHQGLDTRLGSPKYHQALVDHSPSRSCSDADRTAIVKGASTFVDETKAPFNYYKKCIAIAEKDKKVILDGNEQMFLSAVIIVNGANPKSRFNIDGVLKALSAGHFLNCTL